MNLKEKVSLFKKKEKKSTVEEAARLNGLKCGGKAADESRLAVCLGGKEEKRWNPASAWTF